MLLLKVTAECFKNETNGGEVHFHSTSFTSAGINRKTARGLKRDRFGAPSGQVDYRFVSFVCRLFLLELFCVWGAFAAVGHPRFPLSPLKRMND